MSADLQTAEREKTATERVHGLDAEVARLKAALERAEKDRNAYAHRVLEAENARDSARQSQDTFIGLHQSLTSAIAELFPSSDEWLAFVDKVEAKYWADKEASEADYAPLGDAPPLDPSVVRELCGREDVEGEP